MKSGSFFKKLLLYLCCSCVLTAVLSSIIYAFTGGRIFARKIADEMIPRARSISRLASRYQTGQVSFDSFVDFSINEQQGVQTFIYDAAGMLIARTKTAVSNGESTKITALVKTVLSGESDPAISIDWRSDDGIVVVVGIKDNLNRTIGAIALAKPTNEVYLALRGLSIALFLSAVTASAIMLIPAYFGSRNIVKPLRKMTEVSIGLASGDYSIRADEHSNDEIGTLGKALNNLSDELCAKMQDLMLAKNRLHTILEGLNEGIVAIDSTRTVSFVNSAVYALLDCGCDIAGVHQFVASYLEAINDVIATQKTYEEIANMQQKKLRVTISFSQENVEDGVGVIMLLQDVTEAVRLEQTRRDYVANVSHELRTPIASIRSLAETLNDGLIKAEEDRSRYYGYILRESMRLSRLINDLLELSRLQSGTMSLERRSFDLIELLNDVCERMQLVAEESGLTFERELSHAPIMVYSNRDRIEQVSIALIDNAIKYAADDGKIVVSALEQTEQAIVRVRNTGHINAADLPHLFERFYKADASHAGNGTGLGLAITQEVLTQLGETIIAENEDENAVFAFTVTTVET